MIRKSIKDTRCLQTEQQRISTTSQKKNIFHHRANCALTPIFFLASAVLKTIENAGVSYVKLSDQYTKKLDQESKNLNLPYRPEAVSVI